MKEKKYYEHRPTQTGVRLEENPYGFRVNVNNPLVRPYYERYKRAHRLPDWCPTSDDERRDFEAYFLGEKKKPKSNGQKSELIPIKPEQSSKRG